jgi:tetratricopeptide (TPR) repeat protein
MRFEYNKKDYERAIKDYDEAIRLDPKFTVAEGGGVHVGLKALAFRNRGLVWRAKQEYDKAIKDFDEAFRLDPHTARAFNNLGIDWHNEKEYDKAIKDFDEAIRLNPKYADAFNNRGFAWYNKQEYDKAIKDYDEAIRLDPENALAFNNRGVLWSAKQEYDKAIKEFDEAIRLDPKDGWAHFLRSVAQLLDRRPKAVDGFQAVLELQGWKGHLSPYAVVLGHLAARQAGDKPAAQRFLEDSAGKLDETWPYPVVQFLRSDIDEAALMQLATDVDKRTEAHCFLGMDHAIKGRKGEALAHFRWVKDHGTTNSPEYTIAMAELERLEGSAEGPKR